MKTFKRLQSTIRWFYATDSPKSKPLDPSYACTKVPQKFLPFSAIDSRNLEEKWVKYEQDNKKVQDYVVNVNEDGLFHCDLKKMDIEPTYWKGPNYEIRRGIWFLDNQPLPELLTKEIESQYQIYKSILNMNSAEVPGIKLKSEVELWIARQKRLCKDRKISWPYKEWDDLCNVPKTLYFKDLKNAVLLNQGQLLPKILTDQLTTSNQYLGLFSISRGYQEQNKVKEKENNKSDDTFSIQNPFNFEKRIFKGDPSEVTDEKYQKFMEDDFSNNTYSIANSVNREVDHLILAVHGIGQSLSHKYSAVNFAHDCNYLRQLIKKEFIKNNKRYKDFAYPNNDVSSKIVENNCKVQVLPVIWRSDIEFGWDHIYDDVDVDGKTRRLPKLSELNLETAGPIRTLAADVALDILLYYEPRYRDEILKIVTKKFNDIYDLYLQQHPNFKGKVSILGHSLGSAIVLDIASMQPESRGADIDRERVLKFDIENLFCIGSPNGVFQFIKGCNIRPRNYNGEKVQGTKKLTLPKANSIYNLFYASDVVAYRMEPLIYSPMGRYEPKEIDVPTKAEVLKSKIKEVDLTKTFLERFGWNMDSVNMGLDSVVGSALSSEVDIDVNEKVKQLLYALNKNGRVDYILPRGFFDIDLINVLASHIQYFNDADVANFILGELWKKKPDPDSNIKGRLKQAKKTNDPK